MFLGVAYYPEHWPKDRWPLDAKLMREMNVNAARMGEFAWCRFEPSEGEFDFSWMDEAIETLSKEGIKTIMCTPTATPPAWMIHKHPEILPVAEDGLVAKPFGMRRHYCCNSPIYREYTRKIVTAMAEHYGENRNVIGWQIDNELAWDLPRCYCETCRKKFISWLKRKYGSLEKLNRAWGTIFWSQEYSDWDQIVLPRRPKRKPGFGNGLNPSHLLDYYRFASDSWAEYTELQAKILRERTKSQWITTNFLVMGNVKYKDLARSLDFPSWDSYPTGLEASLGHDFVRGLTEKGVFAVLETGGGGRINLYKPIARGGIGVNIFRWRTPLFGAESGSG